MSEGKNPRFSDGTEVKKRHKVVARIVATIIVTFFRILEAVLKSIFSILSALAQ